MFATPRSLYQSRESIIDENGSCVKKYQIIGKTR